MEKGWFKERKSACVVHVILVPKKDGSWIMCIDYHLVNVIIVRYRNLISRLENLLDGLYGACIFSKIDLQSIYHQTRMRKGRCMVVYFGDIFFFSTCLDDHVLQLLKDESLYVNLEKYTFYTQEVIFLGFVMGS
ncbi:hypothetical protein CR513_01775, partial [Mucuna pruriens]